MKALINRLTSNWNFAALLLGFHAWAWVMVGIWMHNQQAKIVGALETVTTLALLMRMRWARLVGTAMLIWICGSKAYGLVARDFTWKQALFAAIYGLAAYHLWTKPNSGIIDDFTDDEKEAEGSDKNNEEEDAKPIISFVHLRRQQRYLEPQVLANALSEAWGLKITGGDDDAEDADGFVAGDNPLFIVMVKKPTFAMFMVHNRDTAYFDDPEEMASHVPNLRFAEIIRDHSAWLAVDLMQVSDSKLIKMKRIDLSAKPSPCSPMMMSWRSFARSIASSIFGRRSWKRCCVETRRWMPCRRRSKRPSSACRMVT
ncbi:MAG: hypothetical protein NTY98_28050 [Verrucomicrobia bacterium]|nr:hypothetical protein [Verrucomicrobiota bacterium]